MGAARRCWWAIAAAVTALVARGTDAGQPATTTFFVALSGSDDNSGTARASAFKSLHRAQQAARLCRTAAGSARCAGMVSVQVGPGVHVLAAPLVFGPQDGSVSYERDSAAGAGAGAAAVVVSSGLQVSGWAPVPAAPAWVVTDLGSAPAAALISRHLWVNGRRADRTEVPGATGPRRPAIWHQAWEEEPKAAVRWLNTTDKTGARRQTCSSTGFVLKPGAEAEAALAWPDGGSGVELVFQGVFPAPWAEPRCAVLNVSKTSTGGAHLTMAQPCHCSYVYKCLLMTGGKPTVHPPTAIVNAKTVNIGLPAANASTPGRWWLSAPQKKLYYSPLPTEVAAGMEQLQVVVPLLEQLVVAANVSQLSFKGLSFRHTTWAQPVSAHGFVEVQSGQHLDWPMWPGSISGPLLSTPGALTFSHTDGVQLLDCSVSAVGAAGVSFEFSRNASVLRSIFNDTSGAAVQFGAFHGPDAALAPGPETPLALRQLNSSLIDSVVVDAGAELRGAAAVACGFTSGTVIARNTIAHVPATAISLGWYDFKRIMHDGGCVYLLRPIDIMSSSESFNLPLYLGPFMTYSYLQGDQPRTVIAENWCSKLGPNSGGGVLYPDEGSGEMTWRSNVVTGTPPKANWANIWVPSVHQQGKLKSIGSKLFAGNFHDTAHLCNHGTNITIVNDSVIDGRHPPPAAWTIMNSSGAPALPWSDEPPPVIPVPPAGPTPPPSPPTPPSPAPPAPPAPPPAPPGKTPCPPKGSPTIIGNYTSFPHTLGAGPDLLGKNATFFCASKGTCCAELSAELCERTDGCLGFALNDRHWFHGLRPQLYTLRAPTTAHHGPGWTFWGRKNASEI